MSGIHAQPAARRSAETESSSRTRAETAARAPVTEARALTGGRPLPPSTRERLEAAFAVPLDDVRVHTDADATDLTDEHDAEALTIGSHIAFEPGRFRPDSEEGLRLLAHEVTHVVQSGGGDGPALGRGPGSVPSEPVEREADRAAERIARGETAEVTPGAAALTTRARIMRKARAGAETRDAASPAPGPTASPTPEAHDAVVLAPTAAVPTRPAVPPSAPAEPEPELGAEETAALATALDAAKQQIGARELLPALHLVPAREPAAPESTPDGSTRPALEFAPTEEAPGAEAPARTVEATARGPPEAETVPANAPIVQTKLLVSQPGDALEREADAVALRVLDGVVPAGRPLRALPSVRGPPRSRAPAVGFHQPS